MSVLADVRPNDIEFTQYLMPHGRQIAVRIECPEDVAAKARGIIAAGFRFECEMLNDYTTISLTIVGDKADHAIEVVPNGPEVPKAVDRMILDFDISKAQEQAEQAE